MPQMSMREMSKINKLPLWMTYTYYYLFKDYMAKDLRVLKWRGEGKQEDILLVDFDPPIENPTSMLLQEY